MENRCQSFQIGAAGNAVMKTLSIMKYGRGKYAEKEVFSCSFLSLSVVSDQIQKQVTWDTYELQSKENKNEVIGCCREHTSGNDK